MGCDLETIFSLGLDEDEFDSFFQESNVVADAEYREISSETI